MRKREVILIPRMNECIDFLGKATVLSMLDANSKYWKVNIENKDGDKTDSTPRHRLYRLVGMIIELSNPASEFQQETNAALSAVRWQSSSF